MTIKKGKAPATLPATLTITGQGSTDQLNVTYYNRKQTEIQARIDAKVSLGALIPYIVESWDTDFDLTEEGVIEFEDEYPGIVEILFTGFHEARRKSIEKN